MKTITVRGIEPDVAEKLRKAASQQGTSINKIILDMIHKELGLQKEKMYSKRYSDLDSLFGQWSEEEFQEISSAIEENRQIDSEIW